MEQLTKCIEASKAGVEIYQPRFYRINDLQQKDALNKLAEEKPYVSVYDNIYSQLKELIKSENPNITYTIEDLDKAIAARLGGMSLEEYGVWVYYPWSNRIVHILDEEEFVKLRTNRNKYKITDPERIELASKRIGVIGLSVGQSVSVTLAMERGFGELRIADFDELEITNLNRLRSGIHNMGIKKTVLVAREIAEIDPFLKVTCFHEGITEDNLDAFLLKGGKLDVLIDECDSVDIKILCRTEAKKHRIPVVMEGSDRATIDVERFDLEPDRPILHGYLAHLDLSKLKDLKTSEEKLPYMLPIAGVETLSSRMKASALEVGQSISTWPQLASAVTLGGGITADVCRRILLDQYHQSGRYFIDMEELIGDPAEPAVSYYDDVAPLGFKYIEERLKTIDQPYPGPRFVPGPEKVKALVEAAALAPSAGNNQPWKWFFDSRDLWLFHDRHRSVSFGDFRNMVSYMALGAAIENLELKAKELGIAIDVKLFPTGDENPVARVSFPEISGRKESQDALSQYIEERHTNRNKGKSGVIDPAVLEDIRLTVREAGADFRFVSRPEEMAEMADIIGTSERLRVFIPAGHYDLFEKEFRWSPEEALKTRDGLDFGTFELSLAEGFGMRLARDPKVAKHLYEWDGGKGLERLTRRAVNTSSAIGLITMPGFSKENCVAAGRALERAWLLATKYGLAFQPMLAPLLHFARILYSTESTMQPDIEHRFMDLHQRFVKVFDLAGEQDTALFLFRIGFAEKPKVKSLRLALEDIYYCARS